MEAAQYRLLAEVEDEHWWCRASRRRVREALAKHRPGRGLQILDAGCGTGSLLSSLARDHHAVGVDLSCLALAYCRNRGESCLTAATVESLPFDDCVFDAVLSIDVLSHESIQMDLHALREMFRVLRPHGVLILQLSAFEWLRGEHDPSVHQARRYTRKEVSELLIESGFESLALGYRLAFLPPLMVLNNLWPRSWGPGGQRGLSLPPPWLNRALYAAAHADRRFGSLLPLGSSVFGVASRAS